MPAPTVDMNSEDAFDCRVRWQTPRDGVKFGPKERFDVAWQVENLGKAAWEPDLIRVTYYSGTRMQVNDAVKLKESVVSGQWTQLVVPLVAPRSTGNYSTVWAMWYGDEDFCHMNLSITVK
jgi:Ig-like domain-containing protein